MNNKKISTPPEKKESTPRKKKTRQSNSSTKPITKTPSQKKVINQKKPEPAILNDHKNTTVKVAPDEL